MSEKDKNILNNTITFQFNVRQKISKNELLDLNKHFCQ